jgi:tetratricopeptide (TPR) repeat protein
MQEVIQKTPYAAALIFFMVITVYIPAMQGGFIWDDDDYVTENQTLKSSQGLVRIWRDPDATPQYYPLVHTSFWLEYRLWQLNPFGYHVVNVLLHAIGAILLFLILKRLELPGAWIAAAIFALHPVHVESVAWITERKNVLSGVFFFSSMLCLMNFYHLGNTSDTHPSRHIRWYAFGFLFFMFALLSKTVTASLPAAMLLLIWWKRAEVRLPQILATIPLFVVGGISGLATAWIERHHVGAMGTTWDWSFIERCLIAGRALWFYTEKIIWPVDLMFNYRRWPIDASDWLQYLYPASVLAVLLLLWFYRKKIGRGPLCAVLFFCGTLFPALGFFDVYPLRYAFVADHFQYLASIGLIVLFVQSGCRLLQRLSDKRADVFAMAVTTLVMLFFATQTWRLGYQYENLETLWQTTIRKNPYSWIAHNNLGVILHQRGETDEAIRHYRRALQSEPSYSEALNNLGSAFAGMGQSDKALQYYQKALEVQPDNALAHYNLGIELAGRGHLDQALSHYYEAIRYVPEYAQAHVNAAILLAGQGQSDEAFNHYQKAIAAKPELAEAHYHLAVLLAKGGNIEAAQTHYEQTLQIDPDFAEAHNAYGLLLAGQGRYEVATYHFAEAIRVKPGFAHAHNNLGILYARQGEQQRAIDHYRKAIELAPDLADAHHNLGLALVSLGKPQYAILHYRRAIQLKPDFDRAHFSMGVAWALLGRLEDAISHFSEAIRIQPSFKVAHMNLSRAYMVSGDKEAALESYRRLKKIEPLPAEKLYRWIEGESKDGAS